MSPRNSQAEIALRILIMYGPGPNLWVHVKDNGQRGVHPAVAYLVTAAIIDSSRFFGTGIFCTLTSKLVPLIWVLLLAIATQLIIEEEVDEGGHQTEHTDPVPRVG